MSRFVRYGVQVVRLASLAVALDTYPHVTAELQEAAARSFDEAFPVSYNGLAKESWLAIR